MTMADEVKTTYKMLKDNNFKVAEIIFEGGISVKDTVVLAQLQTLVKAQKAFGVVHVIYFTEDGQQRVIDITAGKPEHPPEAPPAKPPSK